MRSLIQTLIWEYDRRFTSVVARLPIGLQPLSSKLGKVTLPSIWAATLIVTSLIAEAYERHDLALLGAVVIASIPIGSILKLIVRRSRPKTIYAQNMKVKSYSFPSSHAYAATVAGGYLALLYLVVLPSPLNIIAAAGYTALIVVIGISRIHVGAHYPTDVTAGWILGIGVLYSITQIVS